MTFFEELEWRGLVDNITSPEVKEELNKGGLTIYIGVDPTGSSLHIGHYSTVVAMMKRLKDRGHNPIIIAGGGTGLIGDPKPNVERPMISKEEVEFNIEGIKKQISSLLKTDVQIINNADWLLKMNAIDYLRDYGKYFNINTMLAKDTVKRRLDIGITYTEFSYMLLQSIDFLKLYEDYDCRMQIGGQDQWGNITAGLDLIKKIHGVDTKCYGLTVPLITKADGTKFGKSETGESLWLDRERTSPYEMYQFFLNTEDEKVIEYLKKLTFLTKEEIEELESSFRENPHLREAQKCLAKEVITFLHDEDAYLEAIRITDALFNNDIKSLTEKELEMVVKNQKVKEIEENLDLATFLIEIGASSSKREAREFINGNAISINGEKVIDENKIITKDDFLNSKYIILKRGKKNYYFAKLK